MAVKITVVNTPQMRVRRAVVIALVAMLAFFVVPQATADNNPDVPTDTYVVSSGETMWDIARSYTEPGKDVRDTIDHILSLNDMSSSSLKAGQQILVPTVLS